MAGIFQSKYYHGYFRKSNDDLSSKDMLRSKRLFRTVFEIINMEQTGQKL